MTNTTNYNLLLAEGTDLVNYLTQTNPNFSNLDSIIKGVSDLTVTPATEVNTGTAHAISKSLPDATVIKFTATSNWQTGDTMTLDGNPVTPLKTDGTTLKTGDYIIGSAVLMIQDGTRLTVLVASSPDASDINYDNTGSGLTANKVQGAIDENAAAINTINSKLSVNTQTITPSDSIYLNNDAVLKKSGNVVTIKINGLKNVPSSSTTTLFQLPAGFTPSITFENHFFSRAFDHELKLSVSNSGVLNAFMYTGNNQSNIAATFTYMLG